eukprot:6995522-Lingulodinium_polyedra.AAC.1
MLRADAARLRKGLLAQAAIPQAQRRRLAATFLCTRLLFQAGAWPLLTERSVRVLRLAYMQALRAVAG